MFTSHFSIYSLLENIRFNILVCPYCYYMKQIESGQFTATGCIYFFHSINTYIHTYKFSLLSHLENNISVHLKALLSHINSQKLAGAGGKVAGKIKPDKNGTC